MVDPLILYYFTNVQVMAFISCCQRKNSTFNDKLSFPYLPTFCLELYVFSLVFIQLSSAGLN